MTSREPSISLCMIIKNEEKTLGLCLEHLRKFVDEIVIVDTGSTDKSCEIAKKYTNHVHHYVWNDDFASGRNYSLTFPTKEWILVQDADEFILEPQGLKSFLSTCKADCVAFSKRNMLVDYESRIDLDAINRCNGDYYLTSQEKIIRNHCGLKFKGVLHERVVDHNHCQPKIISYPSAMYHLMDKSKSSAKKEYYNFLGKKALYNGDTNVNLLVRNLLYALERDNLEEFYKLFDDFSEKLRFEQRMAFLLPEFETHLQKLKNSYKERFLAWAKI